MRDAGGSFRKVAGIGTSRDVYEVGMSLPSGGVGSDGVTVLAVSVLGDARKSDSGVRE
jgi:hypothetical protein